jgi:hypothetical protein
MKNEFLDYEIFQSQSQFPSSCETFKLLLFFHHFENFEIKEKAKKRVLIKIEGSMF